MTRTSAAPPTPRALTRSPWRRPRRRDVLGLFALVALIVPLLVVTAPRAEALGNDPVSTPPTAAYIRQATTDTNPVDLPGAALGLSMVQGEKVWLYTTGLEASTTYGTYEPDPGVAFVVQCYGPGIASIGTGWYAARNLDPPANQYTFAPQIRALFVAPSTGTYTCKIRVAAYQPNSSITIPVTFHAGARLHGTPVKPTSSVGVTAGYAWTVPNSSSQPVISSSNPTLQHLTADYTFASSSSSKVTITTNQNVTTCTTGDTFPDCVNSTAGSKLESAILVQPRTATGAPCGVSSPIQVYTHETTVNSRYHHYPILSSIVLDKATHLYGCPRVSVSLRETWLSGAPVVIHTLRPNDERPAWAGIYEHS